MSKPIINKTITLQDGRTITIETGRLARQADGSVVVRMGNTMLLATVVATQEAREGADFLPLSVDYQEKFASAGRIPGSFFKREGRLSEHEILISRLVDRALRPLFPDDYHADTQVNIFMISADADAMPDALACLAASAALAVSDIPFNGPVSEVRVAKIDGELVINPSTKSAKEATLDLIVAGNAKDIMMVEGEMSEVSEAEMVEAIKFAHKAIQQQCAALVELAEEAGTTQKREYSHETHDLALKERLHQTYYERMYEVAKRGIANKSERSEAFKAIQAEYIDALPEDHEEDLSLVKKYFHDIQKEAVRNMVLTERHRLDGRQLDEVRPIWTAVDYLPSAHGSSIFTRGETQSLTSVTLGTKLDELMIDSPLHQGYNKFYLHYNFPAFSTGEVRPNRGPGRREVGHGNLAYRALKKVMPTDDENPYTVRVVSDILESNGSSSMATVCAGSLALMDAGLPIKSGVSGIAMGLIMNKEGKYAVLSDILGDEDHLGDMDFKVTGTEKGLTACQMDLKVDGLPYEVLSEALEQARRGRAHILAEMKKTLSEPRSEVKPHAPRSFTLRIDKELIGAVIGPGGKVVQEIQRETGTTIVIEEVDNAGLVNIFAVDQEAMDKAVNWVRRIAATPVVGEVYDGIVKSIMPFGAFVEFMPNRDGLLHISEIDWKRLESMDNVFKVGEEVKVKLIEIDKKTGKFRLSRKALLERPEGQPKSNGKPQGHKPRE
ncbi:polyribonucleotide nucleotidyltransferase [Catalinimonas alkaloidigena]|uniref:Polyribonucleotide nucleotidyltransferase n=1 Tax=Catalinimonas alkaloidigena TaxID=1075417 RepID=A0A1G9K9Z2_9BACT|nr:polyribonucleotide nucleotidyltransferase [Catalinimonas alkaloidigena]SDL46386.1 polyribonucleotide nucleotidyltransferase [Catalinimonas alkaloidigena]